MEQFRREPTNRSRRSAAGAPPARRTGTRTARGGCPSARTSESPAPPEKLLRSYFTFESKEKMHHYSKTAYEPTTESSSTSSVGLLCRTPSADDSARTGSPAILKPSPPSIAGARRLSSPDGPDRMRARGSWDSFTTSGLGYGEKRETNVKMERSYLRAGEDLRSPPLPSLLGGQLLLLRLARHRGDLRRLLMVFNVVLVGKLT